MTRRRLACSLAALAFAASGSAACTQHTVIVAAEGVTLGKTACAKTECDLPQAPATPECIECYGRCGANCTDSNTYCMVECGRPACDATQCVEYAWEGHAHNLHSTPGVEEACVKAYTDGDERCGRDGSSEEATAQIKASCAHEARVDTIAALSMFACYASTCGTPPGDCEPLSTFGDDLCAAIGEQCPSYCSLAGTREGLNRIGSHLKPAILEAAQTCVAQSTCTDISDCMQAWWKLL